MGRVKHHARPLWTLQRPRFEPDVAADLSDREENRDPGAATEATKTQLTTEMLENDPVKARAIWYVRRGRARSCVRPTLRGLMTAGPDAIRSLAPKQIYALEWRITLDGFFQAPGSTGSPSRYHRPHSAISCGNR